MSRFLQKDSYGIDDLLAIVALLRDKQEGCPWDLAQTHESIRQNFIEETYEAVDAIDLQDRALLQEELGDVLLQVVLHSQMEAEEGHFSFDAVCDGVCKKLILRHPHIFGEGKGGSAQEVLQNWDEIKKIEKGQKTGADAVLAVPAALPALMRAQKVQKRAGKAGADLPDKALAADAVWDAAGALRSALEKGEGEQEALGALLFSAVAAARFAGCDAEEALTRATDAFTRRFVAMEQLAAGQGAQLSQLNGEEKRALWERAGQTG